MPLEFPKGSVTLDFAKRAVGGALAEDVEGDTPSAEMLQTDNAAGYYRQINLGAAEVTIVTKTLNFNAASLAFAAAFASLKEMNSADNITLRLYMGGVLMQTSAELDANKPINYVLRDFKALVGNQECKLTAISAVAGSTYRFYGFPAITSPCQAAISVGSVKLV